MLAGGEDTAEWENLDVTNESRPERVSLLKKMSQTKSVDSNSMIMSTPSPEKHRKKQPKPIAEWNEDDQNDFDKKLSNKTQKDGKVTSTLLKKALKNSTNNDSRGSNSIRKSLVYNGNEAEVSDIQAKPELSHNDTSKEYLESSEATNFCESMLDLMFKLLWEGIAGSSEEAWKVSHPLNVVCLFIYSYLFFNDFTKSGKMSNIFEYASLVTGI